MIVKNVSNKDICFGEVILKPGREALVPPEYEQSESVKVLVNFNYLEVIDGTIIGPVIVPEQIHIISQEGKEYDLLDLLKGGGGRTLTTLYESALDLFSVGSSITLSDNVDKYDEIYIYSAYRELGDGDYLCHKGRCVIDKELVTWSLVESSLSGAYRGWVDVLCSCASQQYSMAWSIKVTDKTTLTCMDKHPGNWSANQCGITKIVGVKYGG